MKKTLFSIMVLWVLIQALAPNLAMASHITEGKLNGGYWQILSTSDKSTFITGMLQGIILCAETELVYIEADIDRSARVNMLKSLSSHIPIESSLDDAIKYIDEFYSDTANIDIPIVSAYMRMAIGSDSARNKSTDENLKK